LSEWKSTACRWSVINGGEIPQRNPVLNQCTPTLGKPVWCRTEMSPASVRQFRVPRCGTFRTPEEAQDALCPYRTIAPNAAAAAISGALSLTGSCILRWATSGRPPPRLATCCPNCGGPRRAPEEARVLEALRAEVLEANLELVRRGLVIYTFGNASAVSREHGMCVIKPSGVPYDRMTPADMVITALAATSWRHTEAID
jgi:hypothetical protein